MAAQPEKDRLFEIMKTLPADATFDDIVTRMMFFGTIQDAVAEMKAGKGKSEEKESPSA